MRAPLVSILMPAWQAGKYIGKAIKSCQAQTYPSWELCIVNDGSGDDTLANALAAAEGDPRISVTSIEHGGQAAATNAAFEQATGEIVARLDADDEHHPERIAAQVAILMGKSTPSIVTCGMSYIEEKWDNALTPRVTAPFDKEAYLNGEQCSCNGSAVSWRSLWERIGAWNPTHDVSCDTDWNLRAIAIGAEWGYLDKPWYYQRRHPGQMSKRQGGAMSAKFQELIIKYRAGHYAVSGG